MKETLRIQKVKELASAAKAGHVILCPFLLELVRWIGEEQFDEFYYHHRRLYKVDITEKEYLQETIFN